jgi:hypothetical protein
MNWLRRFLGLPGSFSWAVRQMDYGRVVRPKSASGAIKYRFSIDGQRRLQWSFERTHCPVKWENAYFFENDFYITDWVLVRPPKENNVAAVTSANRPSTKAAIE